MKRPNPIIQFEGQLGETLSSLERILVRVAIFVVFVVGLSVIVIHLIK
jgi:hypothetical protein